MRPVFSMLVMTAAVGICSVASSVRAADEYKYDNVHSSVSFKARYFDISWIHGRFNEVEGKFSIDKEKPENSKFELTIKADTVDTNNKARDEHLRQADYFDTKQFPTIEFKSTSVKPGTGGYEVTGDFTMHGVTKKVTFVMAASKEVEMKQMGKEVRRMGFSTELKLKRSDFKFDPKGIGPIGDEAVVLIDCVGAR